MTCWGPGPARKQEMSERTARPPKIFKWFILELQTYHRGRFHNHGEGPTKASMLNNPPVPYDNCISIQQPNFTSTYLGVNARLA